MATLGELPVTGFAEALWTQMFFTELDYIRFRLRRIEDGQDQAERQGGIGKRSLGLMFDRRRLNQKDEGDRVHLMMLEGLNAEPLRNVEPDFLRPAAPAPFSDHMVPLNPRFQRKIANAVTALRQGKDDAPGLLLIGPREALDCVRKAPPRLIGVMIDQEMAGREVPLKAGLARPLFDADLLVGATEALHSRLYLALEATGRMTVASFGDRRPQRLNAPAIEQRMIAFRGKIEWQGETSIRLEDFRGLSAAAAGEELGERFWRDVSAEMGNRFLREGFKLARVEDEAKIPLELERGTLEELKDGIRALIGVAIARGEIDAESLRNCDPDRDHIGILTATPASRSLIWLAQGVARGDGVLQVIKEIRRRTKPRLEAVNPQDARGRKIKITGNRVKDQFWIQTCLGAGILEVADGTGHGLMEAENNLRAYLAKTLNIKAERVDALIEGIGPA